MNDIINFNDKKQATQEIASHEARATAEVQASFVIAKRFPRNQHESFQQIMEACKRPTLAEQATYAYKRGTGIVTGPSIRLAEALASAWGNLDCGIREISQGEGMSVCEAYAIDLQTNTRVTKLFHVKHVRDTKQGSKRLTDGRDIYELVANQGARRMRACILAVIPGDVIEAAVQKCEETLRSSDVPLHEQVKKMILAFEEFGIKVEHIEKFLSHNLDSIIPAEIVRLKSVYKSIKDGVASREDFFDISALKAVEAKEELKDFINSNKSKAVAAEETAILDVPQ